MAATSLNIKHTHTQTTITFWGPPAWRHFLGAYCLCCCNSLFFQVFPTGFQASDHLMTSYHHPQKKKLKSPELHHPHPSQWAFEVNSALIAQGGPPRPPCWDVSKDILHVVVFLASTRFPGTGHSLVKRLHNNSL